MYMICSFDIFEAKSSFDFEVNLGHHQEFMPFLPQVDQQARSAVIEFMSAESAENFTRQHNRRMIDLAILSVSRIA